MGCGRRSSSLWRRCGGDPSPRCGATLPLARERVGDLGRAGGEHEVTSTRRTPFAIDIGKRPPPLLIRGGGAARRRRGRGKRSPPMTAPLPQPAVRAPRLTSGPWLNGEPLDGWQGRVTLVEFWTYSCVNCLRTLPALRAWHERY